MASNNFVNSFMTSFKDDLTTQADKSLKKYLKTYKDKLDKIEKTNQTNIQQNMVEYHKKRKELQDKFDQKINAMIAEASKKMDTQLTNIDDKLFTDRSKLYQKILTAAQDLQKKRDEFAKERRKWDKDDKRCAAWLGLSYKDTKPSKKDPKIKNDDDNKDDMKAGLDDDDVEEPANSADNVDNLKIEKITDEDFITIKVDDRVFRTYRGTLTQVKGSFIQKLFGPHHDLIHRDNDGIYYLNCNPDTFGNVLEILRKRGAMPADFKITPKLYAALVEYGILDTFFPTANLSELLAGLDIKKKQDYHVVFQSFRSSDNNSNYLRWNVNHLSSSDQKDDDDSQYWQLNANDNSEILFLKTGFYRITFRCCISYTSATYGQMYINGSAKEMSYHCNTNSAHLKSYNFNDIKEFKEGDKLKLYACTVANKEAKASYLCIERVPDAILPSVGIWTSSATNSYYRQWNTQIKASDRYTLANANKNITLQKGGLYRISGRIHTSKSSAGRRDLQLYEFRNGTNNNYYNNQASNTTSHECHLFDEISSFKKADYFQFYDGNHGNVGNANYNQVQIQHIPFAHAVSHWRSNASKDTYIRIWDYEMWCNDMLYVLSTDKTRIEVKETGNYRISASLTNTQPSGQGHSALFINDTEYCLSRMGCYNGSYRHTTSIQEIVKLNDGDKVHFYSTAPYNSYTYNSFFIEKLF